MGLLDDILGSPMFSSGNLAPSGGPDMSGMPPSGYLPPPPVAPDPRDMSIQGFPPSGVPIPQPRPPGAGPGMTSAPTGMPMGDGSDAPMGPPGASMAPPGAPMGLPGAPPPGGTGGGLMAALGLNDPDRLKSTIAAFGGGLKNIKNSPFPGEVFAGAAGGGIEAGDKQDQQTYTDKLAALDRALKLQQIKQLGTFRDGSLDLRADQLGINQQNANTRTTGVGNNFTLGTVRNQIRQQEADTHSAVSPSRIALNEALTQYRQQQANGSLNPASALTNADRATASWYKTASTALNSEEAHLNGANLSATERAAKQADITDRRNKLNADYDELKTKNRSDYGASNPDGSIKAPRGSSVSQNRPGKFAMGTREDPHMPQTQADFDAIQPGQIFRDPGDGQLKEK